MVRPTGPRPSPGNWIGGFGFDALRGGNAGEEGRVSAQAAGVMSDGNDTSVPRRRPGPSWVNVCDDAQLLLQLNPALRRGSEEDGSDDQAQG